MPSALLLPLLTCAAVLVVSGVAKLRDPQSLDRAVESLRVPAPFDAVAVRRALPWLEVALGLWLLVATGVAHLVVASAVLLLFAAYLGLVVRAERGPAPAECGCFGELGDARVTRVTVARTALLVLAAVLTVVGAFQGAAFLPAAVAGPGMWLWLAATALVVAVAVLVTWRPAPGDAPPPPEVDADGEYRRRSIPDAQVLTEDGRLVHVGEEAKRAARLLVFLSPGCGPCQRIAPLVPAWAADLGPVAVHAVLLGPPAVLAAHPELAGHAWFDPHRVARRSLAPGAPSAVLLGTDGLLAGGPVTGEAAILEFVEEVRAHLHLGTRPAPAATAASDVSGR
ncbi:MauE/DoxX family redox-associated membrane protein [uncultured Phycicoccus sp.]|uniref:MauE/DoxX family redox-associated membrane protein n=1 Tax=uncultured Phycicoccus sp. TaxID=661422 RepID=UPI0026183850|nr:MauE/DoxX family redox-associated membrane protein [uncultured Phycicoccus sp.]